MTGFRVKSNPTGALKAMGGIRASTFSPEVLRFLKRSLTSAIQATPARSAAVIRRNQRIQYAHRINYIPSFQTLEDPSLIVKESGDQWMLRHGKWYRPDIWELPNDVWNDYEILNRERERRMETTESEFIENRVQARFLFKKSWFEIGQSAGINVPCPADVRNSITRRRKPPLAPPKGYAQKRGGKDTFSVVVRNPFMEQTSPGGHTPLATARYKPFSGQDIMIRSQAKHRAKFNKEVASKWEKTVLRIIRAFLA